MICLSAAFACTASGAVLDLSGNTDPTCVENPSAGIYCAANNSFQFTTNSGGGGFFQIINAETFTITQLDFNIPYLDNGCSPLAPGQPTLPTLTIESSFFQQYGTGNVTASASATCDGSVRGQADYSLLLTFAPGIPSGYRFSIGLNDDGSQNLGGTGGWVPNYTATNSDNPAPEPATVAGSVGGLGLVYLLARRRERRIRATESAS